MKCHRGQVFRWDGWKRRNSSVIHSLKWKCHHFDEIFITGCTESCENDSFQCSQWWKFGENDSFPFQCYWLQWRHIRASNHRHIACLSNSFFRLTTKKASKFSITEPFRCGEATGDSPHKGPATRKVFPRHDVVTMIWLHWHWEIEAVWDIIDMAGVHDVVGM